MKKSVLLMTIIVCLFALATASQATIVSWDLNYEFSGTPPESDQLPWLRATFDDGGSSGSVELKMEAVNLTGAEFVSEWWFNYEPDNDTLLDRGRPSDKETVLNVDSSRSNVGSLRSPPSSRVWSE